MAPLLGNYPRPCIWSQNPLFSMLADWKHRWKVNKWQIISNPKTQSLSRGHCSVISMSMGPFYSFPPLQIEKWRPKDPKFRNPSDIKIRFDRAIKWSLVRLWRSLNDPRISKRLLLSFLKRWTVIVSHFCWIILVARQNSVPAGSYFSAIW